LNRRHRDFQPRGNAHSNRELTTTTENGATTAPRYWSLSAGFGCSIRTVFGHRSAPSAPRFRFLPELMSTSAPSGAHFTRPVFLRRTPGSGFQRYSSGRPKPAPRIWVAPSAPRPRSPRPLRRPPERERRPKMDDSRGETTATWTLGLARGAGGRTGAGNRRPSTFGGSCVGCRVDAGAGRCCPEASGIACWPCRGGGAVAATASKRAHMRRPRLLLGIMSTALRLPPTSSTTGERQAVARKSPRGATAARKRSGRCRRRLPTHRLQPGAGAHSTEYFERRS
jgi:hypothetical protein